ncbi:MAG: hypothetical protein N2255_00060, partial [Kiritimatiellae bacterium]|nr:hypothetical protein [Kiritimatiellia bacterium]
NYVRLVSLLHQYGVTRNAHVFMAVNESRVFAGIREITENLLPCVDQVIISGRANPVNENPVVTSAAKGRDLLVSRVSRFTIPGVMVAGLLDGINPCAISTLVFLLSFLTVGRLRGRRLLLVGLVFCLATFLTYGAVGFGLLRALHALSWFPRLRKTVDLLLVAVLLTLAVYSLRDAFRFRRSGSANDVVLKLPQAARERIGRIAHKTRGAGFQLAGVFILGVCVTALESVCTGQVYVPTLALVVRMGTSVFRGFLLLCLYNLMFVVPLIVIVALMYRGLGIMALLEWSKRNVFFSKLLLGGFFLALAGVFLLLNR